jgi:6-pyruvoyltetrahydropterin/6-carboxytetrahydropterin synthase
MRVSIYRKGHFNAAHRLHVKEWSDEKNWEVFGKCNNPNYHGHNYELEVKLIGEIDPVKGYFFNLKTLSDLIKIHVEDVLDHKNLNIDVPELIDIMPTTENLVYFIWSTLRKEIDESIDISVRLWESPRNSAEYPA